MTDRLISLAVAIILGFLVWLYARSRDQEMLDNVPIPVQITLVQPRASMRRTRSGLAAAVAALELFDVVPPGI